MPHARDLYQLSLNIEAISLTTNRHECTRMGSEIRTVEPIHSFALIRVFSGALDN
jgi:hypothetical protein